MTPFQFFFLSHCCGFAHNNETKSLSKTYVLEYFNVSLLNIAGTHSTELPARINIQRKNIRPPITKAYGNTNEHKCVPLTTCLFIYLEMYK